MQYILLSSKDQLQHLHINERSYTVIKKDSFIKALHLAMITHGTSLQVHFPFLITLDNPCLYVFSSFSF